MSDLKKRIADELESLARRATPGPWKCVFKKIQPHTSFAYLVPASEDGTVCVSMGSNNVDGIDQVFVAKLVNALPQILEALRTAP